MEFLSVNNFEKYLNREKPLVEGMFKPADQIQPNGIELTLCEVSKITTAGKISVSNKDRVISEQKKLEFGPDGMVFLEKGCYMVLFNEITNIPKDVFAMARVRSSLLRSGATIETALWDSGYCGRSSALLVVYNENGMHLEKNSRLIQLIFFKLEGEVGKSYSGVYQNENVGKK
ncbi:MAG TPA: deoxyuridine 5'-triphosphate nucleotidohydrolase [Candidatus Wallbacteria bacterium]|nr:deoxyuridine 5'-triphosphate nucleotidohydrolase [Candidatus Wallbacteria bacterium]